MDSKTYTRELRKACVEAVFDEFAEHGDMIRPQYAEQWDEIDASRFLGPHHRTDGHRRARPRGRHHRHDRQGSAEMTSQLLNPPNPPTLHETGCLLLASSGFYIRLHEDGSASLVDGIQDITLADFTSAEIEGIAYQLNRKVGNTR